MTTVLDFALGYLDAGFSLLPIRTGGDKRPAVKEWRPLMEAPPTKEQADRWFAAGRCGLALICGTVSGGVEVIDFDADADATYTAWRDMVWSQWHELLDRVSVVRTPRPGYHVWLRCGEIETPGNTKLAVDPAGRRTLIETRGEGGYALVPGCPAACHEKNECYRPHEGCDLTALPQLSIDERDFLLSCARSLSRDVPTPEPVPRSAPGNDLRPGDDFDRRGWDWSEILGAHGWACAAGSAGSERRWRRPGKSRGWSATTGHCSSGGAELLRVFSSNAHPFDEGKAYGKFRTYALLGHNGDLSAAARELKHLGFGGSSRPLPKAPAASAGPQAPPVERPFPEPIPASLLKAADPHLTWIVNGLLMRGEVTLLSALWKSGKTTLLAHLLRSFGTGASFLGRAVQRAKVLYVTEESEARWAARRDAVGLEDHVEFLVRPFAGKPDVRRWEEFIGHVGKLIGERAYDVVVMDTLANLWPVRDENDASAVQSALMPLHGITEKVGLQLVHHTRKSDGGEATASRGSGALTGFVDTILEFRRYLPADRKDRRRVLSGYGRHDETPDELVIELTECGYVARGDRDVVSRGDLSAVLLGFMPRTPPGLTADQLLESWPSESAKPGRDRLTAALKEGAEQGRWVQSGEGRRGSPYLFHAPFDGP